MGEKIEKTFEPLLASPTTDNEILFGKCLVTFLPAIISLIISLPIFAFLVDLLTIDKYGSFILPNEKFWIIFLLDIPLAVLLSVEVVVLISIRANDVRTASQYGTLVVLPYGGLYILIELGKLKLTQDTLLIISAIISVVILVFFNFNQSIFSQRRNPFKMEDLRSSRLSKKIIFNIWRIFFTEFLMSTSKMSYQIT